MPGQENVLRLLRLLRPHTASIPKIRIGSRGDGGYVVNDDLADLNGVVSIGIGNEVSFDLDLANQGLPVFQYDPTVNGPPVPHPLFVFRKLGCGRQDSENTRSLATMLIENGVQDSRDLLLKFDVEDAEWDALDGLDPELLARFRSIVGEFHWLQRLGEDKFFMSAWHTFSLLTQNHIVTHLHANNCCGIELVQGVVIPRLIEITFMRRDRATFTPSHDPIPSALDHPNIPGTPEIVLMPFSY
jgi:hypothetical protein